MNKLQVIGPQRVELMASTGSPLTLSAVFVRTGTMYVSGKAHPTVLVRDVRDCASGRLLTDHLWFRRGNTWRKVGIQPGDVVRFQARPIEYRTGYWGPNAVRRALEPARVEFRLTPPVGLCVIRRAGHNREAA